MSKVFTYIMLVIAILGLSASTVRGQEIAVSSSATIQVESVSGSYDYRVENLRNFLLKYDSPLADYASDFVSYADKNGLDYRLVPSISGVESTFGKQIPDKSFNAYGWAGGNYNFASWQDSIGIVSTTLRKEYIEKGAVTITQIARRYAPPSTTWGGNVKFFEGKIDTLPLSFDI